MVVWPFQRDYYIMIAILIVLIATLPLSYNIILDIYIEIQLTIALYIK